MFVEPLWQGLITLVRVVILVVISTIVWVPIGVKIGSSPKASRIAQPIVQILASFPANFLFPFAVYVFIKAGISLNVGGILLMASAPSGTSCSTPSPAHSRSPPTSKRRWTASASTAGNAGSGSSCRPSSPPTSPAASPPPEAPGTPRSSPRSSRYGGTTLTATGLGAYIAHATETGDFHQILAGVTVMALYIVTLNRLVWHRLYRLAEQRYSLG